MNSDQIRRKIEKRQKLILALGILFTLIGVLRFVLIEASVAVNIMTQFPKMANGSEFIVGGLGLLTGWYLTKKNKEKIVRTEEGEIMKEKEKRKKNYNWGPRIK